MRGNIFCVYLQSSLPLMLCISGTTIATRQDQARRVVRRIVPDPIMIVFLVLTILTCRIVCWLIVVCLKAWSGAPRRSYTDGYHNRWSIDENASCRKPRILALFLRFCHHHLHASFLHDLPTWRMQRSDRFGVEAAEMVAWKPAAMVGGCIFAS